MTADREKRRAISREAARKRRRVESNVFQDLSLLLPLRPPQGSHLDKPSVIRLTLSYLHLRRLLSDTLQTPSSFCGVGRLTRGPQKTTEWSEDEETSVLLSLLEGFMMVVSLRGDMLFLSSNVSQYIGLSPIELIGHSLFDFTHPCDHGEIRRNLRLMAGDVWHGDKRDFLVRFKSTCRQRGRSSNLKSTTWKVVHCQGLRSVSCLLLACQPLPLSHMLVSTHTFSSWHSMDMRFTHCDPRVNELLGFTPDELLGRSIYDFCYTPDTNTLARNHMILCFRCQSVSTQYRMLVKSGGCVWVESHCAVLPTVRSPRCRDESEPPICIVCVTYILRCVCVWVHDAT
ncbi:endothelial PAS domain-containing protein 1 [Synchiropus splendidus]|uniref:endothelial PAS domain-containing protein 1 n=1 Tax=Synchiropus splendidus TaxID=270530 RepID=UPI00237DE027|nr:endothelial PAS domain-containing protein 1 [Synchiropus splendidus]